MATVTLQPLDTRLPEVAEKVHAIHIAAYSQEARLVGVDSLPPMERSVSQIQSLPESFFGAFVDGVLAGAVSESGNDRSPIEICSLAVDPAFQRHGIGRALVEDLVSRAAGRPMLVSTAAANLPAISLYQSLGFHVVRYSRVPALNLELVHLHRPGSHSPPLVSNDPPQRRMP